MNKKIAIIGAGPAGMACAITALKKGIDVTVFERNEQTGKKILLTGNGHCNITNLNIKDLKEDNLSVYYHCEDNTSLHRLLEENYKKVLELIDDCCIELLYKGDLAYPASMQAQTVRNAFENRIISLGGRLLTEVKVTGIETFNGAKGVRLTLGYADDLMKFEDFDACIICTGSRSMPDTGSDGFGYKLLKKLSIPFRKPEPALTKFYSKDEKLSYLSGVRWKGKISIYSNDTVVKDNIGEIQFLKNAISGIVAFDLSYLYREIVEKSEKIILGVDFMPSMDLKEVEKYIRNLCSKHPHLSIKDVFCGFLNSKIAETVLKVCMIKTEKSILDEREITLLSSTIKNMTFEVTNMGGFNECQVCTGGVSLMSLDEGMQSVHVPGIYFAGEIIDVDGICGGYNIHFALASGIAAAIGCARNLEDL